MECEAAAGRGAAATSAGVADVARRSSGCLPVLALLLTPCLGGYGAIALAAPALVPYLYLHDRAQFAADRTAWLVELAAGPVLAFFLVRWASPADGRLRARRGERASTPPKRRSGPRARRPGLIRGYLDRVLLLLAATSATTLWLLRHGTDAHGPHAGRETFALIGAVAGAVVLVLVGVRRWDRPYVAPVTLESVRAQNRQAAKELRRIRADNGRIARMVAKVEAQLADAHTRRDFATLRTMHHESYGCADSVYAHYRSVQDSLKIVASTVRSVRMSTWQPAGLAVRAVSRNARVRLGQLRVEAGGLAGTAGDLRAEWLRNRDLVQQLNARTADLKFQIRDECGPDGMRWFEELEARREAARAAEGKPVSAAW